MHNDNSSRKAVRYTECTALIQAGDLSQIPTETKSACGVVFYDFFIKG